MLLRLKVAIPHSTRVECTIDIKEFRELFPPAAATKKGKLDDATATFNLLPDQQRQRQKKEEIGNIWNVLNEKLSKELAEQSPEKKKKFLQTTDLRVSLYVSNELLEVSEEEDLHTLFSNLKIKFPKVTKLELVDDNGDWQCRRNDRMFGRSEVVDVNRLLPMPNDKLHTFLDHFPNLEELTLVKHEYPMTLERIRSHLTKLHTLRLNSCSNTWGSFRIPRTCLTPIVCEKLANCVLHLPSLKELIIGPDWWTIIGEDPKKVLEPLVWALGSKPNVELVMDSKQQGFWRPGQWQQPRRSYRPHRWNGQWNVKDYNIPQDQWNVMTKKNGPIPFDVTVNRIKQHYGLVVQDASDFDEGSVEPWVEALIQLQRLDRFDWFHEIFQQMPKVWLRSHNSTTISPSVQGDDSTTKIIDSTSVRVTEIRGLPINQAVMTTVDDLVGYRKFPFKLSETTLRLVFGRDRSEQQEPQLTLSFFELAGLRGELEQQAPQLTLGQEVSFLELARLRGELEQQVRELNWGRKDSYDLYYYVAMLGFSFPEAGQEQGATTSVASHIDETPVQECLIVLQELVQAADEQRVRRLLKELVSQKIDAIERMQEANVHRVRRLAQELVVQKADEIRLRRNHREEALEQEMGAIQARVRLFKQELVQEARARTRRRFLEELVQVSQAFNARRQRQQEALEQEMGAIKARVLRFKQELVLKAQAYHSLRRHRDESVRRFKQELVQEARARTRRLRRLEEMKEMELSDCAIRESEQKGAQNRRRFVLLFLLPGIFLNVAIIPVTFCDVVGLMVHDPIIEYAGVEELYGLIVLCGVVLLGTFYTLCRRPLLLRWILHACWIVRFRFWCYGGTTEEGVLGRLFLCVGLLRLFL